MDARTRIEDEGRRILGDFSSDRIGICDECGWWFPVASGVPEMDARCPKPGCHAEVMCIERAPTFQDEHRVLRNGDYGVFQWENLKPHDAATRDAQLAAYLAMKPFDAKAIIGAAA